MGKKKREKAAKQKINIKEGKMSKTQLEKQLKKLTNKIQKQNREFRKFYQRNEGGALLVYCDGTVKIFPNETIAHEWANTHRARNFHVYGVGLHVTHDV